MNSARIFTLIKSSVQTAAHSQKSGTFRFRLKTRTSGYCTTQHPQVSAHHRDGGAGQAAGPSGVLLCGVLGWFGMTKEEPSPEENLETTVKMAVLAVQEGNLVKADKLLHVALKLANDVQYQAAVTHIYCLMANLAVERGLVGQAERLFTTVLKRLLADGEAQDSNAVVEISLKLSQIFLSSGDLAKAEQGLTFSTGTMGKKVAAAGTDVDEDTLALYGMALDQQAQLYMAGNRLREAEKSFRETVSVATRLHGEDGEQVLVVTNSLATVLSMQGQDAPAAQLLEGVVAAALQLGTPHLTAYMVNLGLVRLKQGMVDMARINCLEARRKAEEVGDKEVVAEADQCLKEVQLALSGTK